MVLAASARYGIDAAPAGLVLVQDLLNTSSVGRDAPTTDLLGDLTHAQRWSDAVSAAVGLSPRPVTTRELGRLRALRDAVRGTLHRRDGLTDVAREPFDAAVDLRLGPDGTVHPAGPGLTGAVLLEVHAAQARGDWARFKLCALDLCDLAFYDRTKNTGARYHAARCANLVNLRNSRERKRHP